MCFRLSLVLFAFSLSNIFIFYDSHYSGVDGVFPTLPCLVGPMAVRKKIFSGTPKGFGDGPRIVFALPFVDCTNRGNTPTEIVVGNVENGPSCGYNAFKQESDNIPGGIRNSWDVSNERN